MQHNYLETLKARCLYLEKENHFYNQELMSAKHALSQTQEALQQAKMLYQQLQADFENALYHLKTSK